MIWHKLCRITRVRFACASELTELMADQFHMATRPAHRSLEFTQSGSGLRIGCEPRFLSVEILRTPSRPGHLEVSCPPPARAAAPWPPAHRQTSLRWPGNRQAGAWPDANSPCGFERPLQSARKADGLMRTGRFTQSPPPQAPPDTGAKLF